MRDVRAKAPVLVVDDRLANRMAFEVLLEDEYAVFLAESGRQALNMSESMDFSVVVLDVRMPLMDGFETAIELRRRERTRTTPILFTSAADNIPISMFASHPAGLTDFVLSPVDPEVFKFKVATFVVLNEHNRVLRQQIEKLTDQVKHLQSELTRTVPADAAVEAQIDLLLRMSEELNRKSLLPTGLNAS